MLTRGLVSIRQVFVAVAMGSLATLSPESCLFAAFEPEATEDIGSLVSDLGNKSFEIREHASKHLNLIGRPAVKALRAAMSSEDPEIKLRATTVLESIMRRLDHEDLWKGSPVTLSKKGKVS